jgi:hypothetical protein
MVDFDPCTVGNLLLNFVLFLFLVPVIFVHVNFSSYSSLGTKINNIVYILPGLIPIWTYITLIAAKSMRTNNKSFLCFMNPIWQEFLIFNKD